MNGIQPNGKFQRDKPVPGCLGRVINLFDLTSNISGNRLLTDRPHNDVSSLSRSRSDVSRMSSVTGEELQDKVMISELRRSSSNKNPHGTPVKMLIAQEMSKDLEVRHNSPNVVARLMGLDTLPEQHPDLASQRSHSQWYARSNPSEKPIGYWQEETGSFNQQIDWEVHRHQGQSECKDIYEIWKQPQIANCIKDKSSQNDRCTESVDEKNLAHIRKKFMEAKWLATDEKLRQTKEFQDALDVLSSNGDLFLKVLQEPNSLFSQPLHRGQTIPPPSATKRITVLRPSKMLIDDKFPPPRDKKQTNKQVQGKDINLWDSHNGFSPTMSTWRANDRPIQPTRIVVLKPNPAKVNDVKAVVSSTRSSPCTLPGESSFVEPEDEADREAREVAKEITQQMRENLAGHRRDETLLSSVFSNGYIGDESSFDKSDHEFAAGNISDSEAMSPASRHSWDYVNRYSCPYSSSSFSRVSYSPESSVCREAKKRLSERWAMMASNGSNLDQRYIRRTSSTLGEMLALSEVKKPEICDEEDESIINQDPRGSTSRLNSNAGALESTDDSPRSLLRSKSVPVSSSYEERFNVQVLVPVLCEDASKEMMRTKASKSSLTGKVTSLFFSRNKKTRKEKSSKPQLDDESQLAIAETSGTSNGHSEVVLSPTAQLNGRTTMGDPNDKRLGDGICSQQGRFCVSQPAAPGIQRENQDQPSPISVLEQLFEEDESATLSNSYSVEPNLHGKQMPLCLSKSNLIDKSPPIGSIARTLSWDECCAETATNCSLSSPFVSPGAEDDESEWLFLVQSLLSMAGLDDEGQLNVNFSRWHSPESPLDPLLRDKYIDLTSQEPLHEAKRRQLRSSRKLVFDCVNAALLEITRSGTTASQWGWACLRAHLLDHGSTILADKVWAWMKEWFAGQVKFLSVDDGDSNDLVERVVRKELIGKGWAEQTRLEMENIGKEIEGMLLEELVEESVVEWTDREL